MRRFHWLIFVYLCLVLVSCIHLEKTKVLSKNVFIRCCCFYFWIQNWSTNTRSAQKLIAYSLRLLSISNRMKPNRFALFDVIQCEWMLRILLELKASLTTCEIVYSWCYIYIHYICVMCVQFAHHWQCCRLSLDEYCCNDTRYFTNMYPNWNEYY